MRASFTYTRESAAPYHEVQGAETLLVGLPRRIQCFLGTNQDRVRPRGAIIAETKEEPGKEKQSSKA